MDTLEHIEALVRVWQQRAIDLEEASGFCDDRTEKVRMETNAASLRSHILEIKQILEKK